MKKIFTIFAAASFLFTQAQVNNGGFETWSSATKCDGWGTISNAIKVAIPAAPTLTLETKDSMPNVHGGSYSIKLKTDSIQAGPTKQLISGILHYGDIIYASGLEFVNTPFTQRPDTLIFSYKYMPASGDTAYAGMFMTKWNTTTNSADDVLVLGSLLLSSTSFQTVRVPLASFYASGLNPDSMSIEFSSSYATGVQGSVLWIDDVMLTVPSNIGYEYLSLSSNKVSVYPNPAAEKLVIRAEEFSKGEYSIFNVSGAEVAKGEVNAVNTTVDLTQLQSGNYLYKVKDTEKNIVYSGKFTVSK